MIFGPLIMILVLALMIAAVVLLVRWEGGLWLGTPPHHAPPDRTPLDSSRSAMPAARSTGRNTCGGGPTCRTSRLRKQVAGQLERRDVTDIPAITSAFGTKPTSSMGHCDVSN
jgi:hypothetical protein